MSIVNSKNDELKHSNYNMNVLFSMKKNSHLKDHIFIDARKINFTSHLYQQYNLLPEAQNKLTIEFVLQKSKYLRYIIKESDILLKEGGLFEIILVDSKSHSTYIRSRDQIKYEISIATNGRYCLISSETTNGILRLVYIKKLPTLLLSDTINKWSFGIISNGKKNDWVIDLINSIRIQNIPEYEIVVCGPSPYSQNLSKLNSDIKIIPDIKINGDIRAPISQKKNSILRNSKYNNICILHDRYLLPETWFENFQKYGNYFDALCLRTINHEGFRFGVDWMKFESPLTSRFKINRALKYDEWHEESIIPGGSIIIKKDLINHFLLDERLHWEELEDMQLSKIAFLNGLLISIDKENHFISRSVNHSPITYNYLTFQINLKYSWLKNFIFNFIKSHKIINRYYKSIRT